MDGISFEMPSLLGDGSSHKRKKRIIVISVSLTLFLIAAIVISTVLYFHFSKDKPSTKTDSIKPVENVVIPPSKPLDTVVYPDCPPKGICHQTVEDIPGGSKDIKKEEPVSLPPETEVPNPPRKEINYIVVDEILNPDGRKDLDKEKPKVDPVVLPPVKETPEVAVTPKEKVIHEEPITPKETVVPVIADPVPDPAEEDVPKQKIKYEKEELIKKFEESALKTKIQIVEGDFSQCVYGKCVEPKDNFVHKWKLDKVAEYYKNEGLPFDEEYELKEVIAYDKFSDDFGTHYAKEESYIDYYNRFKRNKRLVELHNKSLFLNYLN